MQPDHVHDLLNDWFQALGPESVVMQVDKHPAEDPWSEYRLRYQVVFEPRSLEQARVEVWVTEEGFAAIGFETRARLRQRLGLGQRRGMDERRFVGGHEPLPVIASGLTAILDLIAGGQVAVSTLVLPVIGLVSARPMASRSAVEQLRARGYTAVDWLGGWRHEPYPRLGYCLPFERWT